MEAQRALLDQLMGKDRNLTAAARASARSGIHFSDDKVCKHFIVAFCPHSLFTGTKSDMGVCMKLHDDRVREDFRREDDRTRYPYEMKFYRFLQGMIDDIERKMKRQQEKITAPPATAPPAQPGATADPAAVPPAAGAAAAAGAVAPLSPAAAAASGPSSSSTTARLSHLVEHDAAYLALASALSTLNTNISTLQLQIDAMTSAGQTAAISMIEPLKAKLEAEKRDKETAMEARRAELAQQAHEDTKHEAHVGDKAGGGATGLALGPVGGVGGVASSKRMLMCDVCGTFLVAGDDAARMAAHRAGKQHDGYERIRDWLRDFEERKDKLAADIKHDAQQPAPAPAPRDTSNATDDRHDRTAAGGYRPGGGYDRSAGGYDRGGGRGGGGGFDSRRGWGGDRGRERHYDDRRDDRGDSRGLGGSRGGRDRDRGRDRDDNRRDDGRRRSRSPSSSRSRSPSRSRSRDRHRRR